MEHGVDYKNVRFVEVPIPQTNEVLKSGSVDAALVPEPFLTRIVDGKTGYLVSDYVNELGAGIATVFYASTRPWANANRATVKAFQDALFEAQEFARTNQAGTRAAIGAFIKLPAGSASQYPVADAATQGHRPAGCLFCADTVRSGHDQD